MFLGLVSGAFLGFFLKGMQAWTGIKVYVLLLNVDFIPLLGEYTLPEWLEFLFHLLISCFIGVMFVYLVKRMNLTMKGTWILSFLLTLPTIFLYFPLSYLAVKEVPALLNGAAVLLWATGHFLYALTLPPVYKVLLKTETRI